MQRSCPCQPAYGEYYWSSANHYWSSEKRTVTESKTWLEFSIGVWYWKWVCSCTGQITFAKHSSHSQRSKGCSGLSQVEKLCKSARFSPTKDGDSSLWISDEYRICDPSANVHLEAGVWGLRCWAMSHDPTEQVLNQDWIGVYSGPGIWHLASGSSPFSALRNGFRQVPDSFALVACCCCFVV